MTKAVVTRCVKCNKRPSLLRRTRCQRCTDQMTLIAKRIRHRRLELGICLFCGKVPAEKPFKRCRPCLNYLNKYSGENKLKRAYGMDNERRLTLYKKQGGFCAFCGLHMQKNRFHVDHCHLSGKIRGAVHMKCNIAIGIYENCGGKVFIANIKAYLGDPL